MKRTLLLLTIVLISTITSAQKGSDEQELKNLVGTLQKAWNSGAGETFASAFAEPHDFIVWNGYYFKNNTVQKLFYVIDKIKFLKEEIALLHILGAVAPKDEARPKDPEVLITMIVEKKNGNWKIVSFHNLDLEVFQNEKMLKSAPAPPSVMYASWY